MHLGGDKGIVMDCAVVQAVFNKHIVQQEYGNSVALVEPLTMEQEAIPGGFAQDMTEDESAVPGLTAV